MNGSDYTDKEYQMAALYGLNNAGSPPANSMINGINTYEICKGLINKSYNNLLAKFDINSSELNAFFRKNLVSVPNKNKLPENCVSTTRQSRNE
jgi:hypothetical protein